MDKSAFILALLGGAISVCTAVIFFWFERVWANTPFGV
jgi:uncharacterized membrane protein